MMMRVTCGPDRAHGQEEEVRPPRPLEKRQDSLLALSAHMVKFAGIAPKFAHLRFQRLDPVL